MSLGVTARILCCADKTQLWCTLSHPQPAAAWRSSPWAWAAAWRSWCRRNSPTWASLRTSASCWWSTVLRNVSFNERISLSVNVKCFIVSQGGEPFREWGGTRWRAQHNGAAASILWQGKHGVTTERCPPDWGEWAEGRFKNSPLVFKPVWGFSTVLSLDWSSHDSAADEDRGRHGRRERPLSLHEWVLVRPVLLSLLCSGVQDENAFMNSMIFSKK